MENNNHMHQLIDAFPEDIFQALKIADQNPVNQNFNKINNVIICGMGGSGIGGKLVSSWIIQEMTVPVGFCQDYDLPNYVDNNTLVIASSYSGNTEETISAVNEGHKKGASIIAITSGGQLSQFCDKWNYKCILLPGGNPPRTALAFSMVQLVHILVEIDLIDKKILLDFASASKLLTTNQKEIQKRAQDLAEFINGKELMIYSETKDEPISIRARQQYNENSKILVNHHVIPEMNHNELLGWTGGSNKYAVLFLDTGDLHENNYKRLEFNKEFINKKTPHIYILKAKGESYIERSLYMINIIDWSSLILAEKNNIDSINIDVIEELKTHLKK